MSVLKATRLYSHEQWVGSVDKNSTHDTQKRKFWDEVMHVIYKNSPHEKDIRMNE